MPRKRTPRRQKCTAKSKASGQQCSNWARKGYPVCHMHGAGTRVRQARGERKDPLAAGVAASGAVITPELALRLGETSPDYGKAIAKYQGLGQEIEDLRGTLVRLLALEDLAVEKDGMRPRVNDKGEAKPPIVLEILGRIAGIQTQLAKLRRLPAPGMVRITLVRILITDVLEVLEGYERDPDKLQQLVQRFMDRMASAEATALPDATVS